MNIQNPHFLLATNGSPVSLPAMEYGIWLASLLQAKISILGILENSSDRIQMNKVLDILENIIGASEVTLTNRILSRGNAAAIIRQAINLGGYSLTVFGPLDQPVLIRWLRGRSIRRILTEAEEPFLYARKPSQKLDHMLLCAGGLGYARHMEEVALMLALKASSKVTLLHVVEPISYKYRISNLINANPKEIIKSDTPQGRSLREGLAIFETAGIEAKVMIKTGHIVHEILKEYHSGDYDLIGLGSGMSSSALRNLATPNVTAEIADAISAPILVAKSYPSKEFR